MNPTMDWHRRTSPPVGLLGYGKDTRIYRATKVL